MTWKPRPSDITWAENMCRMIKVGGVWIVPMNGNIYKFYQPDKEIHLVAGEADDLHEKNVICFKEIGYSVIDKR